MSVTILSPEVLAWMAGFFDGEGSISIRKRDYSPHAFAKRICIVNTRADILEIFRLHFGGKIRARKRYLKNQKVVYEWVAQAKEATRFLGLIRPYLKLKAQHADLWFDFCVTVDDSYRIRNLRGRPITGETSEYRMSIVNRLGQLNAKGDHGNPGPQVYS